MSLLNLVTIDNGNSNPHVGFFNGEDFEKVIKLSDFLVNQDNYLHYKSIKSSVGKEVAGLQLDNIDISKYKKDNLFFDMKIDYSKTLGEDRLVQAYFAYQSFILNKVEKILLIDAGTFTTADIITKNGFEGGYIFPGNQTYLNSYSNGELLPTYNSRDCSLVTESPLPTDTKEAILEGYKLSTKATFSKLIKDNNPSLILLTGGQSEYLKGFLEKESEVSVIHDPNLIHYSLFYIAKKALTLEAL